MKFVHQVCSFVLLNLRHSIEYLDQILIKVELKNIMNYHHKKGYSEHRSVHVPGIFHTSTTIMGDSWKDLISTTPILGWIENCFPSATTLRFISSWICFVSTTEITRWQFFYLVITARIFQLINNLAIAASLFSIEVLLAFTALTTSHSRCNSEQK